MSGDRYERELVNTLTTVGMAALRAPSSGSATDRELPDVLVGMDLPHQQLVAKLESATDESISQEAIQNAASMVSPVSRAYGIESKNQKGTTLYVDSEEVDKLTTFCEAFGATPRLSARYTEQRFPTQHYLIHPSDARLTEDGNYGLPVTDIDDRASEIVYPDTSTQDPKVEFVKQDIPPLEG